MGAVQGGPGQNQDPDLRGPRGGQFGVLSGRLQSRNATTCSSRRVEQDRGGRKWTRLGLCCWTVCSLCGCGSVTGWPRAGNAPKWPKTAPNDFLCEAVRF
jgi:hypothetical protein